MKKNSEYRILDLSDAELFQKLRLKAVKEHPEAFSSSFEEEEKMPLAKVQERLKSSSLQFVMGAFQEDDLVGIGGFYQHLGAKLSHRGTIWGLYIDPKARGLHIGRKLLEALIHRAKSCINLEEILISITVGNEKAKSLYTSLGFTSLYIEPRYLKVNNARYDAEYFSLILPNCREHHSS